MKDEMTISRLAGARCLEARSLARFENLFETWVLPLVAC